MQQYLDHKNCICKNKLICRVIEECTSVINETMINNKDNITNNNNTYLILFIVFLRDFIYPKVKTSIYQIIKMVYKSLKKDDKYYPKKFI